MDNPRNPTADSRAANLTETTGRGMETVSKVVLTAASNNELSTAGHLDKATVVHKAIRAKGMVNKEATLQPPLASDSIETSLGAILN